MKLVELDSVDNSGIMFPFVPAGDETAEGIPIGNDVTSDEAIRKAINIAIDRQALVDGLLDGFGTPAYSVADKLRSEERRVGKEWRARWWPYSGRRRVEDVSEGR